MRLDIEMNSVESPEISPYIYSQLFVVLFCFFLTKVPRQFSGKRIIYLTNCAGTNRYSQEKEARSLYTPIHKN